MLAWLYATRVPAIRTARIGLDPGQTKEEFDARIPARARWKASLVLLESFRFRLNRKDSRFPCSVVFSSREPVPTSLENTLALTLRAATLVY
jgi:hypothetical protein